MPRTLRDLDPALRARLDKLLALAQAGVGGEAENADRMLRRMLAAHGFTVDDLIATRRSGRRRLVVLHYANDAELAVAVYVAADVLHVARPPLFRVQGKRAVGVEAPVEDAAVLGVAWEVYRKAYRQALADLPIAFVMRNGLAADVPRPEKLTDDEPLTPEERAQQERALNMAAGMARTERPVRRLGTGAAAGAGA